MSPPVTRSRHQFCDELEESEGPSHQLISEVIRAAGDDDKLWGGLLTDEKIVFPNLKDKNGFRQVQAVVLDMPSWRYGMQNKGMIFALWGLHFLHISKEISDLLHRSFVSPAVLIPLFLGFYSVMCF